MAKQRTKIPSQVDEDVMYKSRALCYCGNRGDQIHHLDGNPNNNDFDNLVFLCKPHHEDAEIANGMGAKRKNLGRKILSSEQIKKQRDRLYAENGTDRAKEHKKMEELLAKTDERFFKAAMEAGVLIEIKKLNHQYKYVWDWDKRRKVLSKMEIFAQYTSPRIAYEVYEIMEDLASFTRSGMSASTAGEIENVLTHFFPKENTTPEVVAELGERCAHIGWGIAYDAFIHLCNLATGLEGLKILRFVYRQGLKQKNEKLKQESLKWFGEIEQTLRRPERKDLGDAQTITALMKANLEVSHYSEYKMEQRLRELIREHFLEIRFRTKT